MSSPGPMTARDSRLSAARRSAVLAPTRRPGDRVAILAFLLLAPVCLSVGCGGTSGAPNSAIDVDPFIDLARDAEFANITNQLFLIDDQLVFWDASGDFADASYARILYGATPDQVLCSLRDSIAGPQQECEDTRYQGLFETITSNLDKPDLGLGPEHKVERIPF